MALHYRTIPYVDTFFLPAYDPTTVDFGLSTYEGDARSKMKKSEVKLKSSIELNEFQIHFGLISILVLFYVKEGNHRPFWHGRNL
jgi:hypothetical protein